MSKVCNKQSIAQVGACMREVGACMMEVSACMREVVGACMKGGGCLHEGRWVLA